MIKRTHVVLHHSAGKDGVASDWEELQRQHIEDNGWDDIGYHFGIERIGEHFFLRTGRPLEMAGAHCPQERMNVLGIGLCLVGNFEDTDPECEMLDMAHKFVAGLCTTYNIPAINVQGHNEIEGTATLCPGKNMDMDAFRLAVSRMLVKNINDVD